MAPQHRSSLRRPLLIGRTLMALLAGAAAGAGCSSVPPAVTPADAGSADASLPVPDGGPDLILRVEDPTDGRIRGLEEPWITRFNDGDVTFEKIFLPSQGLGPVYIRHACASCHEDDAKGPGTVTKVVVVEADGFTPAKDQSRLPYGSTVRPQYTSIATRGTTLPEDRTDLNVSVRVGPAVFGRGYLEAIADEEIERVAAEQASRDDGIRGRINRVEYVSVRDPDELFHSLAQGDPVIGRFGVKARLGTIDDFAADAFQGDMGMTSPFRPEELPNPESLTDDDREGLDLERKTVVEAANYVRLLALPARPTPPEGGAQLFEQALCSACHVPSLRTRKNYPIPQLADLDAPVYTDLLLHDMGDELADGQVEHDAGPRDFRTAPLIGIRHLRSYLHDGRARTVEEAILMHGGPGSEATGAVDAYEGLSDAERATLLAFVSSL